MAAVSDIMRKKWIENIERKISVFRVKKEFIKTVKENGDRRINPAKRKSLPDEDGSKRKDFNSTNFWKMSTMSGLGDMREKYILRSSVTKIWSTNFETYPVLVIYVLPYIALKSRSFPYPICKCKV